MFGGKILCGVRANPWGAVRALHTAKDAFPRAIVGTYSWGDKLSWEYDPKAHDANIRHAFHCCLDLGLTTFDTSDMYGEKQHAERMLGSLIKEASQNSNNKIHVCGKYMPWVWRFQVTSSLIDSLKRSLERLNVDKMHTYMIASFAPSWSPFSHFADALATATQQGLVERVGLANSSTDECKKMATELEKRGVKLACNQVEFSVLRTHPLQCGLKSWCDEQNVTMLAYSPLGMARLTGRFDEAHPPPNGRRFGNQPLKLVTRACEHLAQIAHHRAKTSRNNNNVPTPAQVAINFTRYHGFVPVVGVRHPQHATDLAAALTWNMGAGEAEGLQQVAAEGSANHTWQHG